MTRASEEFGRFCVVCLLDCIINSLSRWLRSFKSVFSTHSVLSLKVKLVRISKVLCIY
jgi:hypothetical protein